MRVKVAKVGLATPRSSSLIRWKDIPRRSDSSSWVRLAFVRSSSIASPSALWAGDRGLVRRRGGKVKAAFPPGSSGVNRYSVKRRVPPPRRDTGPVPRLRIGLGKPVVPIVTAYSAAEYV